MMNLIQHGSIEPARRILRCFRSLRFIPFAALIALAPSVLAGDIPHGSSSSDGPIGTINGEPVSAREYRMIMERQMPLVFSDFQQREGLEDHADYWSEKSGPDGPLAALRKKVAEELSRVKVVQSKGRQMGLVSDTSFEGFLREFESENQRRRHSKETNQIVYGPTQYRLTSYYYVRFGDLIYRVTNALAKELESTIPEEAVQAFYKEYPGLASKRTLEEARRDIVKALSLREAEKSLSRMYASARVQLDADKIRGILPRSEISRGESGSLSLGNIEVKR